MKTFRYIQTSLLTLLLAVVCVTRVSADETVITWDMSGGSLDVAGSFSAGRENFSSAKVRATSTLAASGSQEYDDVTYTKVKESERANDKTHYVDFVITPKEGVTFVPTSVSFNACKMGTDAGRISYSIVSGDTEVSLRDGINPGRNTAGKENDGYFFSSDIAQTLNCTRSTRCILRVYFVSLNNDKETGIANVTVTGEYSGTPIDETVNDFSAILNNQAGTLIAETEQVKNTSLEFGVTHQGTRVAADDASAVAVISGKYHNDHGMTYLVVKADVLGPVKISVGQCQFSTSAITVKDADKNVVATKVPAAACWKNNHDNVTYIYYDGDATTLTISGMGYCPYIAVEAIDESDIPRTIEVSYSADDILGAVPPREIVQMNSQYELPKNQTIYKEGYTLTGWSDGTNTYSPGQTITVGEDDITLTPLFRANTKTLDALENNVTAKWYFGKSNGAPNVAWERSGNQYLVTQSDVEGETQDMPLIVNTDAGKFNNSSRTDHLAQVNGGTKFIIPAVSGMKIEFMEFSSTPSGTITDGSLSTDMTVSGNKMSYTYVGNAASVTVTVNEGRYGSGLIVTYPRLPKPEITGDLASSYTVRSGSPKTLQVEVSGATRYQWYKNTTASTTGATAISGATTATYTVAEPAEGEYYYLAATNSYGTVTSNITTFRITTHTFDFTSWSDDTKANLRAGSWANAGTTKPSSNWSDVELESTKTGPTDATRNNCFWQINTESGTLHADGKEISELKGLSFCNTVGRSLAIALDYPSTDLGTYHGGSYLWLGGNTGTDYFTIPAVKVGSVIKIGIESHKSSDARGITLKVNGTELKAPDGSSVPLPTTYVEQEWLVKGSGDEEYVNVIVHHTNGCHIYYIDCDMAGFSMLNTSYVVKTGESYLLEAGTDYENISGAPVTYTSGNTDLATISSDGLIRMLRGGTVTITAHQDANGIYSASDQTFTVSSTKAQLEVSAEPLSLEITDAKVKRQTVKVTVSGTDFTPYSAASMSVSGSSDNITVTPSAFKVENDGTIAQQFTVTYATDAVDNGGTLTLTFTAEDKTKTLSLPYGRSVAYGGTTVSDVTGYRQWDWSGASADVPLISKDGQMTFADAKGTWPAGVTDAEGYYGGTQYLAGTGQYLSKTDGCFQGSELYFHNTVPGTLEVVFSNTGTSERPYRYLNVNGVNTAYRSKATDKVTSGLIKVPAGGVTIQGRYND